MKKLADIKFEQFLRDANAAARGDPEGLHHWLLARLGENEARVLIDLISGKHQPPKRRRGRPRKLGSGPMTSMYVSLAADKYRKISRRVGRKKMYGQRVYLLSQIAEKYHLEPSVVESAVRRSTIKSSKEDALKPPSAPSDMCAFKSKK